MGGGSYSQLKSFGKWKDAIWAFTMLLSFNHCDLSTLSPSISRLKSGLLGPYELAPSGRYQASKVRSRCFLSMHRRLIIGLVSSDIKRRAIQSRSKRTQNRLAYVYSWNPRSRRKGGRRASRWIYDHRASVGVIPASLSIVSQDGRIVELAFVQRSHFAEALGRPHLESHVLIINQC